MTYVEIGHRIGVKPIRAFEIVRRGLARANNSLRREV